MSRAGASPAAGTCFSATAMSVAEQKPSASASLASAPSEYGTREGSASSSSASVAGLMEKVSSPEGVENFWMPSCSPAFTGQALSPLGLYVADHTRFCTGQPMGGC